MARRYLGVDFGDRRLGLAIAEDDIKVARPFKVIELDHQPPIETFRTIISQEAITDLVVGLPRGLDGQETEQTAKARSFAHDLEALGLPVTLQDEAATSVVAGQRPGPGPVDDAAAALILQDYLDSL